MSKLNDSNEFLNDSKYRQYVLSVEKALKTFEYPTEWADLISALGKLHKIIQNNAKYGRIPKAVRVSKRLSQCMNPSLPFGVHLKTIECYKQIFETLGTANLGANIHLYSVGFFPLLPNATINVKKALLDLYEKYFIPLGQYLKPALTGFLNGVLPALEEGSEFYDRTFNLLTNIENAVGRAYFFTCLWECIANSPTVRLPALLYASTSFDRKKSLDDQLYLIGSDVNRLVDALCASADDTATLVQRQVLDFITLVFPLDSDRLLKSDFRKLMKSCVFIVLRRDMSLNRRLYGWLLGTCKDFLNGDSSGSSPSSASCASSNSYYEINAEKLIVQGVLELLNDEKNFNVEFLIKILRLFMYLMDRPECGASVLNCLFLPVLYRIRDLNHFYNTPSNDETTKSIVTTATTKTKFSSTNKQQLTMDELMKVLNLLLSNQKPGFLWDFLSSRMENLLNQESLSLSTEIVNFCSLVEFLLNSAPQLPQSSGNNLHLNKLICNLFRETLARNERLTVADLLSLIDLSVKLFAASEKLTVSTAAPATQTTENDDVDADDDFEDENLACYKCVRDGLKLFCNVSVYASSEQLTDDVKRQLAVSVCRLLKELADYPIYCLQTKKFHLDAKEEHVNFVGLLCDLCLKDDVYVSYEYANVLLYIYALSKSILQEHKESDDASSSMSSFFTMRRSSYATRVLLKPILSSLDVRKIESSTFFNKLSKTLWNRLDPTTTDCQSASVARLLLYLHSVDESGGSSLCEDLMVDEMTSTETNLRSKSLNKFAALWILWRRCAPEYFLPGYPVRPFERAPLVMLNGIDERTVDGHLCRGWLDDCLEHNDLLVILKILTLTLAHPQSARVSLQSGTFHQCESDAHLIKFRTNGGQNLYHYLGPRISTSTTVGLKLKKVLLNTFSSEAIESTTNSCTNLRPPSSAEFDNFDVADDDELLTNETRKNSTENVEKIVQDLLREILDVVEREQDDVGSNFDATSSQPRTSSGEDKLLHEVANCSPIFERYSPTPLALTDDYFGGEMASEASEFLTDEALDARSGACANVHALHAHLLLYYEPYESYRSIYAFKSLINMLQYAPPRIVGQILVSSVRSTTSTTTTNEIENLLMRHMKSVLGNDFFAAVDVFSDDSTTTTTTTKSSTKISGANMYFEILLTLSLYYLRSVYVNSPVSTLTVDEIELNWRTKSTCVDFLTTFFRLTSRLAEEAGRSFAFYIADVLARCKFQKCLLHSIMSTLTDEKLTRDETTTVDESISSAIVRFNLQSCKNGKLLLHSFQASLLKLLEVVLELEFRIRNARAETSTSGVLLDKLSISQHVSPAHSASHHGGQQPLAFQKLYLFTVLNALKKNYSTHSSWLSLVVRTLPYMEKSMPTFVLHVSEQLCRNMEVCLKNFKPNNNSYKSKEEEDVFPPDYLATVLEVLTIICHYCMLDSSAAGCLIPSGSPTTGASGTNNNNVEKSAAGAGDIFVNLFRVFTFTDPSQNSMSPAKSETNFFVLARQQLFAAFPHILSTLCNIWAVTKSSDAAKQLLPPVGSASHIRRLLLDLLSPLAANHSRQFLSSMALVWLSKTKSNAVKEICTDAQTNLVELLLSVKTFPLENFVSGVLQTLKNPVRVKNISEKDAFPLEVSLLEMVHCTLCNATSGQLRSCWPTVQQLIVESLPVVQVSSSKLHLFKIFADFVDRSTVLNNSGGGDKTTRKEFQEVCHKLVDCLLEIVGLQLAQPTWLKRTLVVKDTTNDTTTTTTSGLTSPNSEPRVDPFIDDQSPLIASVKDTNNNNKRDAIACGRCLVVIAERLPTILDAVYKSEDKDKLQLLLTQVWFNVYPFLKSRSKKNCQNFVASSSFLSRLSQYPLSRSVWRKSALDLLCDPQFFYMDEQSVRHWMIVVDNLMTQDRHSFKDMLTRTAVSQSSGLFTSKEQEYELRTAALKRLTFIVISSELDQYQPYLPEIQERITENLRLSHVPHIYAEVLICFRALIVRLSPQHLTPFWPTIVAELVNVLMQIEEELSGECSAANDYKCAREDQLLHLYLSACKLLEALSIFPSDRITQFQMYNWVFFPSVVKETNKGYVDHSTRIVNEFEKIVKTGGTKKISPSVNKNNNGVSLVRTKTLTKIDELYAFFRRFADRQSLSENKEKFSLETSVKTIETSILTDLIEQWL